MKRLYNIDNVIIAEIKEKETVWDDYEYRPEKKVWFGLRTIPAGIHYRDSTKLIDILFPKWSLCWTLERFLELFANNNGTSAYISEDNKIYDRVYVRLKFPGNYSYTLYANNTDEIDVFLEVLKSARANGTELCDINDLLKETRKKLPKQK